MNPLRVLRYDEYLVAERLASLLKKKAGYSVHIPLNHQQKGFDLLVHSAHSGKSAKVQVKGSTRHKAGSKDSVGQRRDHAFWFNRFECPPGVADYYVLVGVYPVKSRKVGVKSKRFWEPRMLMMPDNEMKRLLEGMQTKSGKPGHSFYLEFTERDEETETYLTRGAPRGKRELRVGKFAIEKSIRQLEDHLGK